MYASIIGTVNASLLMSNLSLEIIVSMVTIFYLNNQRKCLNELGSFLFYTLILKAWVGIVHYIYNCVSRSITQLAVAPLLGHHVIQHRAYWATKIEFGLQFQFSIFITDKICCHDYKSRREWALSPSRCSTSLGHLQLYISMQYAWVTMYNQ